jgi:hypothetical protein
MLMVVRLAFVPRASLRIFHRDGPDSSHYSLLGLNSPRFGDGIVAINAFLIARASVKRNWGQSKISLMFGVAPEAEAS